MKKTFRTKILAAMLAAVLVLACFAGCAGNPTPTATPTPPTPTPTEVTSKPASLLDTYGYDATQKTWSNFVDYVILSGSWYEMGYQYGEQVLDYLRVAVINAMANAIANRGSLEAVYAELPKYEAYISAYFKGYIDFIKGISDSTGFPYNDVLICMLILSPDVPSCSTVAAWGDATADGHTLGAVNTDGMCDFVKSRMPNIIAYPSDGNPFILSARNCSMNSKGLMCLMSAGQNAAPGDRGFGNPMIACIYLAAYCDTADQAKDAYIAHARRSCGENLMIVDQAGNAYHMESTATHYAYRVPGDNGEKNYLIANNSFLTEEMQSSLFTGEDEWTDCQHRYDTVEYVLKKALGNITVDTLREAEGMNAYYDPEKGELVYEWNPWTGEFSPENKGLFFTTLHRRVMDATDLTIYICEGPEHPLGGFTPGALGTYSKVTLQDDLHAILPATQNELSQQLWRARRDTDLSGMTGDAYDERVSAIDHAWDLMYSGQNWYDLARLMEADGNQNLALQYYAKALSDFCEGQCYARTAQDSPAQLLGK